jgi:hypothetical protein
MMLRWQQQLQTLTQTMGLHFRRSLYLMTRMQCATFDEIADYLDY